MTVTEEVESGRLAELLKQVRAGNEVLLTQDHKPVAKLVAALHEKNEPRPAWKLHAISGHRVLTPNISQAEIAEKMFDRQ
jgi:antitoxin (DNA-binding transcriptional repressor) of toxin-antitoxin stability system